MSGINIVQYKLYYSKYEHACDSMLRGEKIKTFDELMLKAYNGCIVFLKISNKLFISIWDIFFKFKNIQMLKRRNADSSKFSN